MKRLKYAGKQTQWWSAGGGRCSLKVLRKVSRERVQVRAAVALVGISERGIRWEYRRRSGCPGSISARRGCGSPAELTGVYLMTPKGEVGWGAGRGQVVTETSQEGSEMRSQSLLLFGSGARKGARENTGWRRTFSGDEP